MIKYKHLIITYFTLIPFVSCAPKNSQKNISNEGYSGNISISGAFALYPLAVIWAEEFKKENPNVRFNISAGGAGKGIADVLTNMVDIGLVSRYLHPEEIQNGANPIQVASDAVIGTINSKHPNYTLITKRGLTQKELKGIFLENRYKLWSDIDKRFTNHPIEVYGRSDAAGAAETWAKFFGANQEDLKGIGIYGDPGIAQSIKDNRYAIGFNNISFVYSLKSKRYHENIAAIPIDLNRNGQIDFAEDFYENLDSLTSAIANGKYPSPPARDLFFVVQDKVDSELLQAFIWFILQKKQQSFLTDNGFVPLDETSIANQLKKIKTSELQITHR